MSNSPLVSYTKISPNKNSPRNHTIDTITIHCTAGRGSVESIGNIFAATAPYKINDKVYASLIDLCVDICQRNGIKELKWKGDKSLIGQIDKQNMTVHRWFANKACPGDYIYNRLGDIANEVNKRLNRSSSDSATLYKVQVGAYKNKDNAEKMLTKIKSAGFDGFIVKVDTKE